MAWETNWFKKQGHKWWVGWEVLSNSRSVGIAKKIEKKSKNNTGRNYIQVALTKSELRDLKE